MVMHTIRTKDGGTKEVDLFRAQAVKVHCTECMGWDENPSGCTSTKCALFPFRGKSMLAVSGHNG